MFQRKARAPDDTAIMGAIEIADRQESQKAGGAWHATALSAVAVGISCLSFYLSALQGPSLAVYVPPTLHYGRDGGGDTELFAIPVTIANDGALGGTIVSMELEVRSLKTNATKRYYSAFLGEHPRDGGAINRQFAPLSIPGRSGFSETVRFYPVGKALPRLIDAEGEYAFRLQLNSAAPATPSVFDWLAGRTQPTPVTFQMTLPWISDQQLSMRRATIAMYAKGFSPTASAAP